MTLRRLRGAHEPAAITLAGSRHALLLTDSKLRDVQGREKFDEALIVHDEVFILFGMRSNRVDSGEVEGGCVVDCSNGKIVGFQVHHHTYP